MVVKLHCLFCLIRAVPHQGQACQIGACDWLGQWVRYPIAGSCNGGSPTCHRRLELTSSRGRSLELPTPPLGRRAPRPGLFGSPPACRLPPALLSSYRWKLPDICMPSPCRTTLHVPPKPVWLQPCPASSFGASLASLTLACAAHMPALNVATALVWVTIWSYTNAVSFYCYESCIVFY